MIMTTKKKRNGVQYIGEVGTDTGLVIIGDPCQLAPDRVTRGQRHPLEPWDGFVAGLTDYPVATVQQGIAVVTSGGADGGYPVSVVMRDGQVAGAFIDFGGARITRAMFDLD
jgi:hypothetical protein